MAVLSKRESSRARAEVVAVVALLLSSLVAAPFPRQQLLQHLPTVLVLLGLDQMSRRRRPTYSWLSHRSVRLLLLFIVIHIVGARYIYSYVPYDDWTTTLTGISLSDVFGWKRNHYDRFAHFAFGALAVLPLAEVARARGTMATPWALLFALSAVLAISALYECFEWGLTIVLSPNQAESYNGQQGDVWDAQKDITLAALGACAALWPVGQIVQRADS